MAQTLAELGVAEPYPRAFDADCLGASDLADLLRASGWREVRVETVELDATRDSADQAADTATGTPFGPLVSALSAQVQDQVRARLITKLGGSRDGVTVRTASNIARGSSNRLARSASRMARSSRSVADYSILASSGAIPAT